MPSVDPDFSSAIRDLFDGQDYTKEPAESEESPIQSGTDQCSQERPHDEGEDSRQLQQKEVQC